MFTMFTIDNRFSLPYCISLNFDRQFRVLNDEFAVTDNSGIVFFKVSAPLMTLHSRLVLRDVGGNPIVTLHKKIRTLHERWEVFRGESTNSNNLLFSVKRTSTIQWKIQLDVFLAYNTKEAAYDFMVDVDWFKQSCVVYDRQSSTNVARMENNNGRKVFTVHPSVDCAFIAALILIVDEMNNVDRFTKFGLHHMTGDFGLTDFALDSVSSQLFPN